MKNLKKSLKFQIISKTFIYGTVISLITSLIIKVFLAKIDGIADIFAGFIISFFLFVDTTLYIFKNIKKINSFKLNLNLIKDLLIISVFFIILNKFFKLNFVLIAVGITITPISVSLLWISFKHNLNYWAEE
ncbi:MAG: hypothetical protein EVJ48_04500 [Candidatus Acidulodesulfobacterium acidiphilum]|uniref:Uncharacterized protein n=1 Tax=Candidatus Acidulodesulfobacterium acidiphilum TaxID=2597224 RepID=A0A520XES6_9DELT|nr:MAG: hypothetical protein EVJ48_04500 [Candidatus Acidulodesulfobacterium acidiphilum]